MRGSGFLLCDALQVLKVSKSATWTLHDNRGKRHSAGMRQRDMSCGDSHSCSPLGGPACEMNRRPLAWLPANLDLLPTDAAADSSAQSLGRCLLSCKTGGKALFRGFFAQAVGDFAWSEDPMKEAVTKSGDAVPYSVNLRHVRANPQNHPSIVTSGNQE